MSLYASDVLSIGNVRAVIKPDRQVSRKLFGLRNRLPLPSAADHVVKALLVRRKQVNRGLRTRREVRVSHA